MKVEAEVRLCSELADLLKKAMGPDNVPPKGFELRDSLEDGCYTIAISGDGDPHKALLTVANTIDEITRVAELVESVIRAADEVILYKAGD